MNSTLKNIGKHRLAVGTFGVAFLCSACATTPQATRTIAPENATLQAIYKETTVGSVSVKTSRKNHSADNSIQNPVTKTREDSQIIRDSAIQQIGYYEDSIPTESKAAVTPTGRQANSVTTIGTGETAWGIECCQPEPRVPAAGNNPMAPGMIAYDQVNLTSFEKHTDEYLCDGGDREQPVYYHENTRLSLDTEDTILEFTDRHGVERIKPSNRVCIYAPRFASVRTVSRPHEESSTNEVAGLGQLALTQGIQTRLKLSQEVKREMTGGIAVRSRVSGLDSEATQSAVSQLRALSINEKLLNVFQALSFVRSGKIDDAESVRLNKAIQAASAWTREQFPIITAKADTLVEGHFEQSTAVITGIDEKKDAENLRIVKLANKQTALPGDIVEFTIRYDNLGGREVHHIRIVDNLTPRLEYVADSGTSDQAGRLVLQDNGEGSQILIWELDEPLKGKSGGVVTFKALVR